MENQRDRWLSMGWKDYIQRKPQRPLYDKTKFYLGISSCSSLNPDSTDLCAATLEAHNPEDKLMRLDNLKMCTCSLRFKVMTRIFKVISSILSA